jgi:hypothetical protein
MTSGPRIFLHLTKTAGGTLKRAISSNSELKSVFIYGPNDLNAAKEKDLSNTDILYGHSIFGIHEELAIDPRYMCFMRHPITRTISHYFHLRNVEKGPVGEKIRTSKDINDFFKRQRHWEFSNFMTKIISGIGNGPAPEGVNLYKLAICNIDKYFDFIGFQEFFPFSVRKMSKFLGVEVTNSGDINVGRYDYSEISQETLSRIEALNESDMRLYRYCLKKFL